jgi:tRNA pseudouridine38-40 synthase
MERRTYALLLAYDGGPYKGFQPHPALPTVGGVVSAVLHRCGVRATPYGASRTDAGVHARAQVASFHSRADLDPAALCSSLRRELPETIRPLALRLAPKSFHSHWSSIGKVYRYRVSLDGEARAWRLPGPGSPRARLDLDALSRALAVLEAAPDVGAFCAEGERGPKERALARCAILAKDSRGATLEFAGAGFGKHQVRHMVTAAVGVAVGALSLQELARMLARSMPRPRRAPAEGLWLHRVLYPPHLDPFPDLDALAGP